VELVVGGKFASIFLPSSDPSANLLTESFLLLLEQVTF
jgi:hypothetical protein